MLEFPKKEIDIDPMENNVEKKKNSNNSLVGGPKKRKFSRQKY